MVLDPFAGSGTTLIVAQRMHRNSIGIEIKLDYYQQIKERLQPSEWLLFGTEVAYGN